MKAKAYVAGRVATYRGESPTETEALLYEAINVLGRMALRKRSKLWAHDVRQLEDELFEVLEALSNVRTSENSQSGLGIRTDGTP